MSFMFGKTGYRGTVEAREQFIYAQEDATLHKNAVVICSLSNHLGHEEEQPYR